MITQQVSPKYTGNPSAARSLPRRLQGRQDRPARLRLLARAGSAMIPRTMPVHWELHGDVLLVTLVAHFDGPELVRAIADGLARAGHRSGVALLLDTRASLRSPTPEALRTRAAQLAPFGPTASHAAIVTAPTPHRRFLARRFVEASHGNGAPRVRHPRGGDRMAHHAPGGVDSGAREGG